MKNPVTPAGIEPATFRFVAQHLNDCATAVPMNITIKYINYRIKQEYNHFKVMKPITALKNLSPLSQSSLKRKQMFPVLYLCMENLAKVN